jgi:hypothetical protein
MSPHAKGRRARERLCAPALRRWLRHAVAQLSR